jgi:hypothetical protein
MMTGAAQSELPFKFRVNLALKFTVGSSCSAGDSESESA